MKLSLSQMVSLVMKELESDAQARREIEMMRAPSECYGLVNGVTKTGLRRLFDQFGMEPKEFVGEVEARTSAGWVWRSGLLQAIDMLEMQ